MPTPNQLTNWLPDFYFLIREFTQPTENKLLSLKIETSIVSVKILFQVCVPQIMCKLILMVKC